MASIRAHSALALTQRLCSRSGSRTHAANSFRATSNAPTIAPPLRTGRVVDPLHLEEKPFLHRP